MGQPGRPSRFRCRPFQERPGARRRSPVPAWQVTLDQPGRLRLKNRALYRKSELCQAIERELMSVLGIDQYRTSSFFCTSN